MDVIAEGVEQEDQASRLIELGCVTAQGFYYSKPIPAEELEQLLESSFVILDSAVSSAANSGS